MRAPLRLAFLPALLRKNRWRVLLAAAPLLHCGTAAPASSALRAPGVVSPVEPALPSAAEIVAPRSSLAVDTASGLASPIGGSVHYLGARRAPEGTLRGDWDTSAA